MTPKGNGVMSMFHNGGSDMGRRRGQRTGHLFAKGPSWILRWREDVRDAQGNITRAQFAQVIAPRKDPATGKEITKREAQRIAWQDKLARLDAATVRPGSLMTVAEFIRARFEPDWVRKLKAAGRKHYGTAGDGGNKKPAGQLAQVIAAFGDLPLRAVRPEHVQAACDARLAAGKSTQTVTHLRNVVSAVFTHARALEHYHDGNPAEPVRLPEMCRKESHALDPGQAAAVLRALPRGVIYASKPVFEMVALSCAASLNVAECCGLRWKWLNLTAAAVTVDGDTLPPHSVRVVQNNYRGAIGSPKAKSRRRTVPLATPIVRMLEQFKTSSKFNTPDDLVFAGARGRGINENNLRRRELAPIGRALGLPFPLSWHVFRHTHATLAEQLHIPLSDRQANMGHAAATMTLHYTHADLERRRQGLEQIAALLEIQ